MNEQYLDQIKIENLCVFAHHGVYEQETLEGQPFYVNLTMYTSTQKAGLSDCLEESTNYGEVALYIDKWMKEHTYRLLEAVAENLSRELLLAFPLIQSLDLEIRKPKAPIPLPFESVSVKIHRGWHKTYIALGSNMGDSRAYVEQAVRAMEEHPYMQVLKVASLIQTKPYGGVEQADFINSAACVRTLCSPEELLGELHKIEQAAGRERLIHWGPRTLDLDILLYDELVMESENLTIPHADMMNRDFVLKPMCELAPDMIHPVLHKSMSELLHHLTAKTQS